MLCDAVFLNDTSYNNYRAVTPQHLKSVRVWGVRAYRREEGGCEWWCREEKGALFKVSG